MGSFDYAALDRHELVELIRRLEQVDREREEEIERQREAIRVARKELELAYQRYAAIFDLAPIAYLTLEVWGGIREINQAGARLLALPKRSILGMPFATWVAPDERRRWREHLRGCSASEDVVRTELVLRVGTPPATIPVEIVSHRCRFDLRGQPPEIRMVVTDLGPRRVAEEERRQLLRDRHRAAAESEAKGRFLAVLSHELRTPLTPVLAGTTVLERREDLPPDVRALAAKIRRNVELEVRLIDDLLDLTRIERDKIRLHREVIDVHEVVESVADICRAPIEEAGIELHLRLEAASSWVFADPARLHQSLWNLVRNATNHTPRFGRITISSQNRGTQLLVAVDDTGVGFSPADGERLFEPFEQARSNAGAPGLGLGLAIGRELMRAQGGELTGWSAGPGRGAHFEIRLAVVSPPSRVRRPTRPEPVRTHPARVREVLVVEDHEDTAELLELMLRRASLGVRVARNATEARALMDDSVDLLLTDIGLPDGDGVDLVRELRERWSFRAIALSGWGAADDRRRTGAAGFDLHLTKPVTYEALVAAIDDLQLSAARVPGATAST